ncbi:hypothetical protein MRX96_043127, partial [Rhipicephalus microplus]
AADASALEILERIGANEDNSDLDLSDSEDSLDGAGKRMSSATGILDEEEQDCHYDSDTDGDDGGVSNSVMLSRKKGGLGSKSTHPCFPSYPRYRVLYGRRKRWLVLKSVLRKIHG